MKKEIYINLQMCILFAQLIDDFKARNSRISNQNLCARFLQNNTLAHFELFWWMMCLIIWERKTKTWENIAATHQPIQTMSLLSRSAWENDSAMPYIFTLYLGKRPEIVHTCSTESSVVY